MSGLGGEGEEFFFLATPGRRFAAAVIDGVVLVLAYTAVAWTGVLASAPMDGWPLWLTRALGLGYLLVGWGVWGQTVGKHVLGLRVVRAATGRPAMGAALVRLIGYFIASIPTHIGLLPILWHPRRQGWHDQLAGTVVIDQRGGGRPLGRVREQRLAGGPALYPLRLGYVAVAGVLYALVAIIFTWPLLPQILTHRIGGPGHDGSLFMWALWYFAIGRYVDPDPSWMHTLLFYWPRGVSLSFHTMVWLNGLVAQPLVHHLPLITAYNFVLLGNMVLCSLGAYCLTQRFVRSPMAAWVGGLSFGLSPYFIAQAWLGHLSSVSLALLPWVALGAVEMGRTHRQFAAVLTGLALAVCAYMDYYLLVFGGLVLVSVTPTAGRLYGQTWRRIAGSMGLALAVTVVGVAPLTVAISDDFGRPVRQSLNWRKGGSLSLGAFTSPNPLNRALRAARIEMPCTTREGAATAGLLLLALAMVGGAAQEASMRPWLLLGMLALLLAAGPIIDLGVGYLPTVVMLIIGGPPGNGLGPSWDSGLAHQTGWALVAGMPGGLLLPAAIPNTVYDLAARLPVVPGMGAPLRLVAVALLAISVLAAVGLERLARRWPDHARVVTVTAGLLVLAELLPASPPLSAAQTHPYYDRLRADPELFAVIDVPVNPFSRDYFEYQTQHHKPMAVAVHSRPPKGVGSYIDSVPLLRALMPASVTERGPTDLKLQAGPPLSAAEIGRDLTHLRADRFRYLLVHREMLTAAALHQLDALLTGRGDLRLVYQDRLLAVWELLPEATTVAPPSAADRP